MEDEVTARASKLVWGRSGKSGRSVVVELVTLHISYKEQSLPSVQNDAGQRVHRRASSPGVTVRLMVATTGSSFALIFLPPSVKSVFLLALYHLGSFDLRSPR